MKLPGINYGSVQSLGREDIGGPARVAAAQRAETQAMVGIVTTAADAIDKYDEQQAIEATKDNNLELQRRSLQFHQEFDQRDFYPSDHPYVIDTPGFEDDSRQSIPAHELRPAAYKAYMEGAIEELTPNIHRNRYRDNWKRESESQLVSSVTKFTLESIEMRKKAYTAKLFDQIDMARTQQSYDVARTLADDDALTADQRRDQNKATDWDETTDDFENARIGEDPEIIQMKIDAIEAGQFNDVMTPREQRQYRDQLEAQLDSLTTRSTVQSSRERSVAIQEAKVLADHENRGYLSDPAVHSNARNELDRTGAKGTAASDLDRSQEDMATINRFSKTPLSIQKAYIADLRQSGELTPRQIQTVNKMEKAYELNIKSVQNDVMAHAVKLGLINFVPINMQGGVDEFFRSTIKRASDYQEVKMILGAGNGMLSKPEAIEVSSLFKNADPADQAMLITQMYDYNPEVADELFEQLKVDDPSAYQAAAVAFKEGRDRDASKILQGVPMIKDMTDEDGAKNSKTIEQNIREKMGSMYGTDTQAKESAVRAGVAFVAEAQSRGEYIDDFDDVVNKVTGGQIEIDNSVTVGPRTDKTEDDVVEWKNSISPSFVDRLTNGQGIDGMTNEEFVYKLRDGEFDWHYTSPGQWRLTYENVDGVDITLQKADGTGEPFLLEYDETGTDTTGAMDMEYLEEGSFFDLFSGDIERLKPEYRTNPDAK